MKLLVVDDDAMIAEFIRLSLKEQGHAVDVAHAGTEGRTMAMVGDYDAVVLDYMLPDVTGVEVLRELRARGRWTPVLMLTSRAAKEDVIGALDAGADDYLVKPFEVGELVARLRALARRGGAGAPRGEQVAVGDLALDRLRRTVTAAGKKLRLTPKEYALLEYFLLHPERIVTRTELLEKVWEMHFDPGSNVVDVHVARIRGKLQRAGSSVAVATLRGAGYMLTAAAQGD
ncbi:MAG TPA: response regulator transcription factor [Longimicrobium sp.]|nr:response regulator transcription factor [Longimicrobium sp.]